MLRLENTPMTGIVTAPLSASASVFSGACGRRLSRGLRQQVPGLRIVFERQCRLTVRPVDDVDNDPALEHFRFEVAGVRFFHSAVIRNAEPRFLPALQERRRIASALRMLSVHHDQALIRGTLNNPFGGPAYRPPLG